MSNPSALNITSRYLDLGAFQKACWWSPTEYNICKYDQNNKYKIGLR